MAKISTTDPYQVVTLSRWLGLNESPDGDTGLKWGQAALMRNFRVTREGHLQIRPGYGPMCTLSEGSPVRGLWSGAVGGKERTLAACGGHLWALDRDTWECADWGDIHDGPTHFFGFGGRVYLLTGSEYYVWDGENPVAPVEGYVPLVVTAAPPEGGGQLLERVNRLTGKKRGRYSPDGEATVFHLPEEGIDEFLAVEGTDIPYEADLETGTITFETAPEQGVDTLTFTWRKGEGDRAAITAMTCAEFYNGNSDTRVFLYGNGTHEVVYSDLEESGAPSAEYFPDLNVMAVGAANTPVTAVIRHYDRLLVFKPDEGWTAAYSTLTTDTGEVTAAFYCTPLNRSIGCAGTGQACLVENDPLTLHGGAVHRWSLSNSATRDERNARPISDRVANTLSRFQLADCLPFDDQLGQEFWLCHGGEALIWNYGVDVWYYYDNLPIRCMARIGGELYFGTGDGRIMHFSRDYRNDDLAPIDARWESGSLDFDRDWRRKYAAQLWVSMKPESQCRVTVSAQSDRAADHPARVIAHGLATLGNVHFGRWSFNTNRRPQVESTRIRVKKHTFYKLVFSSLSQSATATILGVDIRLRYAGSVR